MSRYRMASLMCVALLLASASVAAAAVGNLWSTEGLGRIDLVGDISPDPGLECLALDDLGEFGFYRLGDGQKIGDLPSPFNDRLHTTYMARDFDGNGLAEILCIFSPSPGANSIIGLLAHDGREFCARGPTSSTPVI